MAAVLVGITTYPPNAGDRHEPPRESRGVEPAGHPWLSAVPWHPAMTAADDRARQRLVDGVVGAVDGTTSTGRQD